MTNVPQLSFIHSFIVDGEQFYTWRDTLGVKYSDLPGVRKYHDFLVVKTHDGRVVMKVREPSTPSEKPLLYDSGTQIVSERKNARVQTTQRTKTCG